MCVAPIDKHKFNFTLKQALLIISVIIFKSAAFSQFKLFEEKILRNDSINRTYAREKIFVHYDKPTYKTNDTIWLKGYVLSAADNAPNDSIGIAYIELINEANKVVKRISAPCFWGYFCSRIILYDNDFKQGTYTLRAYTTGCEISAIRFFLNVGLQLLIPLLTSGRPRLKR